MQCYQCPHELFEFEMGDTAPQRNGNSFICHSFRYVICPSVTITTTSFQLLRLRKPYFTTASDKMLMLFWDFKVVLMVWKYYMAFLIPPYVCTYLAFQNPLTRLHGCWLLWWQFKLQHSPSFFLNGCHLLDMIWRSPLLKADTNSPSLERTGSWWPFYFKPRWAWIVLEDLLPGTYQIGFKWPCIPRQVANYFYFTDFTKYLD